MNLKKALYLSLHFITGTVLSGCSLGYDSPGPYPYSHVNQTDPTPSTFHSQPASGTQSANNTPAQNPTPRTKPTAPETVKVSAIPATKPAASTTLVTVRKGDTVYAISRRYGVTVRSVISTNNLKPPYLLKPGQNLSIPTVTNYTVMRGDTVYGVSRAKGVMMNDLVRINGLKQPYALRVGQVLKIPGHDQSSMMKVEIAPPPQISGKGFMWPVRGNIISSYGPKQAGYHNDGINIRASPGTPVYASESGVVVHASNKLEGYGNLILIKHQNGWVTAYAHNQVMLVKKGQNVVRGQAIARVGSSGRVNSPQLHFEMRKGSRAVDPNLYLKS